MNYWEWCWCCEWWGEEGGVDGGWVRDCVGGRRMRRFGCRGFVIVKFILWGGLFVCGVWCWWLIFVGFILGVCGMGWCDGGWYEELCRSLRVRVGVRRDGDEVLRGDSWCWSCVECWYIMCVYVILLFCVCVWCYDWRWICNFICRVLFWSKRRSIYGWGFFRWCLFFFELYFVFVVVIEDIFLVYCWFVCGLRFWCNVVEEGWYWL